MIASVIPAQAGIQIPQSDQSVEDRSLINELDSRLRGNDEDFMAWPQSRFDLCAGAYHLAHARK